MKRKLLYLLLALIFAASTVMLSACSDRGGNEGTDSGHMHSLVHHVPIAATCVTEGNIEYWSCAGCGKYFSDENAVNEIETAVIPAMGHSWGEWETVYPVSCTYDGFESRTCSTCHANEMRTVSATGHDFSGGWKFDEQTHWQECKNCAEKKDAAAHSFSGDSCAVCGYTITYTENLDYELSGDGSYYIVSGRGSADDSFIFIPAQFAGKPVKSIGESAFENDDKLTGIYLPETVESIADYAFYDCPNLTSVKMQDGLKTIGVQAFRNCEELQDIEISGKLNTVGQRAFENCNALTNVYIRDLAAWCAIQFDGEQSNPLYYAHKFYLNGETVTELVIPNEVTAVADYVFYGCNILTSVKIGNNVESIGDYAFYGCSMTSAILSNKVTTIGDEVFSHSSLTSIVIPNSVTTIGSGVFSDCYSLKSVTISDSVTTISGYIFNACVSLASITIPDGVTSIGKYAFASCASLTNVTMPNSVTTICDYVFNDCSSLRNVIITDSVMTIGEYVFNGCTSLTSITIPNSMKTIGYGAFDTCISLTEAYFADPYGWRKDNASGEIIPAEQLINPQTAAELLKSKISFYKK